MLKLILSAEKMSEVANTSLSLAWGVAVWRTEEERCLERDMQGNAHLLIPNYRRTVDSLKPWARVGLGPPFSSILCAQHTGH